MTLVRLRRERVPVACGLLSACLVLVGGPVRAGVPDFDAPQLLGADIGKGEGALAADLNRDGLQDIAACGAKGVGWYLQAPVGVFTFHAGPTVGACHALRVADLDGDGAPDVVYIGDTGSGYVHVGADGASFTNTAVSAADSGASILAVGDLNNDGAIDIGCGSSGTTPVHGVTS